MCLAVCALLILAGCAAVPATPTPTAIPLAATATSMPRPTRPASTASVPPAPTSGSGLATPTSPVAPAAERAALLQELARLTVQGFLDRLAAGEIESALSLYLSDSAYARLAGELRSLFAGSTSELEQITLEELKAVPSGGYTALALLRWRASGDGSPATQTMALTLTDQRGLWKIDTVQLGARTDATPTPAAAGSQRQDQRTRPLSGKLVFQVSSGGDLYTVNADGSGLRRLTDGLDPAWSPDGQTIAFTRWRTPWGVYLIRPDGSGEQRIVDSTQLKEVTWSPDGSSLLVTMHVSSGEPIEICIPGGYCFTVAPFSLGQMWRIDLAAARAAAADALRSLPLDLGPAHAPTWSPVENRIVYAGNQGLAWITADAAESGRFEGGSAWDGSPSFSPDGRQIAFMSRIHDRWEIWVMNADGSARRRLTSSDLASKEPAENVAPAWSPDGKLLAFLSDRDGPWRIYVMNADGSEQRPMFGDALDRLGIRYEFASERVLSWSR